MILIEDAIGGGVERRISLQKAVKKVVSMIDFTVDPIQVLEQLREVSKIKISPLCSGHWNYSDKRTRFNKHRFLKKKIGKFCLLCKEERKLDRHHIVQLKNGGVSIKENIIGVCRVCHELIHERKL